MLFIPTVTLSYSAESHYRFHQGTTRPLWPCPVSPGPLLTPVHSRRADIHAKVWASKPVLSYSVGVPASNPDCVTISSCWISWLDLGPGLSPTMLGAAYGPCNQPWALPTMLRPDRTVSACPPLSWSPTFADPCQIHRDKGRVCNPIMLFSNSLVFAIVFKFLSNAT